VRKTIYVLDSYAILAYFQAEPGGLKVKELGDPEFKQVESLVILFWL